MKLLATQLAVFAAILAAQVAHANPYLESGRKLYASQRFSEALGQLDVALKVPSGDAKEQAEILDLMARCQVAEGKRPAAEASFTRLLGLDPRWEPDPTLSPKILEVFQEQKARVFPPGHVRLQPLPGTPAHEKLELTDPWRKVASVVLFQRSAPDVPWRQRPLRVEGRQVVVALGSLPGGETSWYVEARASDGTAVARFASPEVPRVFAAAPEVAAAPPVQPAPTASARRIAAWTAAGVAVAAAVSGTAFQVASASSAERARNGAWADEVRAAGERARAQAGWSVGFFVLSGAAAGTSAALFLW